jgi:hypothetical protein
MESRSSDEEVAFHLLPAKRTKRTDWNKCIICQTDTKETVSSATGTGISKFIEAAQHREDEVYERVRLTLIDCLTLVLYGTETVMPNIQAHAIFNLQRGNPALQIFFFLMTNLPKW